MSNRLTKQPAITYLGGTPSIPPRPAYCTLEVEFVQRVEDNLALTLYYYNRGMGKVRSNTDITDPNFFRQVAQSILGSVGMGVYEPQYEYVCYPATPGQAGSPGSVSVDSQPGWNSGGRSRQSIGSKGYVQFQVAPKAVAVVCGLSTVSDDQSPGNASHAFYITQGNAYVMEQGVTVATVVGIDLATSPVFKISRDGGQVNYEVGPYRYSSSLSLGTAPAFLDATLYAAGDYVENPLLANLVSASGRGDFGFEGLINRRARGTGRFGFTAVAQALGGSERFARGTDRFGFSATTGVLLTHNPQPVGTFGFQAQAFPALDRVDARYAGWASSCGDLSDLNGARGGVNAGYGTWRGEALGNTPQVIAGGANMVYAGMHGSGVLYVGATGGAEVSYGDWITSSADRPIASVNASWGPYTTIAYESPYAPGIVQHSHAILLYDSVLTDTLLYLQFDSTLQLLGEVDAQFEFAADMAELVMFSDSVDLMSELELLLRERLILDTALPGSGPDGLQYAVNLQTGAISRYDGFDFYATLDLGDRVLGAGPDGFYELARGLGNDGQPLSGVVDFGEDDYDSVAKKHLEAVYIGVSLDGGYLILKAEDQDGRTRTYKVQNYRNYPRARMAQGQTSRSWGLRLLLQEVTDAELEQLEVVYSNTSRRWTR